MLHFNDLKFFAVPRLPAKWEAPLWLKTELGIFSGRLYFEWSEYSSILDFLGVTNSYTEKVETVDDSVVQAHEDWGVSDGACELTVTVPHEASFTQKPLTFLQQWLAIRRKGQDFSHTPL